MRLLQDVLEVAPGKYAIGRRIADPNDFYFNGHFPECPVVPAVILIEMLAQTGGIAAAAAAASEDKGGTRQLRVAAVGPFRFPAPAGPGVTLEATARVTGQFSGLYKIEGDVTADGVLVASGSLTLAG
jgi:3-hydroxyacyl-[acyl-carrier-protein] dehydratase